MKRQLTGALALLLSIAAHATTLNPVGLLNPTGSTSGQAIVSTGASSAPGWANLTATSLAAQAANTVVANVTGSSASPTAFVMPSCSTSTSALNYTSGTGWGCNAAINAAQLGGATFAAPGPIGSTTASTGAFTTLAASSTISGTGFSTYLASPPAIGTTAAAAGKFTTLQATSAITPAYPAGIVGNVTGSNVTAGSVGEYLSNTGTTVPATSATLGNVTSLALTAGDWDIGCSLGTNPAGSTTTQGLNFGLTTTSAAQPAFPNLYFSQVSFSAGQGFQAACPTMRLNVSGSTTVYLVSATTFSVSTLTHTGYIWARRR